MKREDKNKIVKTIIFVSISFSLFFIFYTVFAHTNSSRVSANYFLYLMGRLMGLISFLFLSILIISGDTARFFDRFFGMDRIIKFQRKFSLIICIFVVLHPVFFIAAESVPALDYLLPNFSVLPLALGTLSFYIFIVILIASRLYKRISYDGWQYLHVLTYILFFFVLYHAVNIGSSYNSSALVKTIYFFMLIFVLIGIVYRTNYKLKQRGLKFFVKNIEWETKDAFTLTLKPNKQFSFKAGQFCFLRLKKDKLYARHPFTISSSPKEENLSFTMKLTGRFTKAASELKKGEEVIVDGPFGIFTIEDHEKDLVFIAGGVGIAPFMSMIKNQLESEKKQNVLLLYGSKTKDDIIFKKQLDSVKKVWFKKVYVLDKVDSNDTSTEKFEKGPIRKEMIESYVKDVKNSLFYICGPEPMKEYVKKILLSELKVSKNNIRIESFFW